MIPFTEKAKMGSIRFLVDESELLPTLETEIPHEAAKKVWTMCRRYGVSKKAARALYNGQAEYLDVKGQPII